MKQLIATTFAATVLSLCPAVAVQAQAQPLRSDQTIDAYGRGGDSRNGRDRYDRRAGRYDQRHQRYERASRIEQERLLRELALTRSQEKRIEHILRRDQRQLSRLRERLYERERRYAELQRRRHPGARGVLNEIHTLERRIEQNRWRTRQQVESVLTPRQRDRLARYERAGSRRDRGYDRRFDRFDERGSWLDLFVGGR